MLKLSNISIKLGEFSLHDINISIDRGDYFVLLGKSGSGKTILLEMIAGLVTPNSGNLYLNEKNITHTKIGKRNVGIVFQDNSLFPHLSVRQNIVYALKANSKSEKEDLVNKYAELTGIKQILDRNTRNLSGGEAQRVALARTLVRQPDCILLDEPLASLDVQLKSGLRKLLREINRLGVTILHVTHDYEEASSLADKVAVLHDGSIIQQGKTKDVFLNPKNEFVAHFTGTSNYFNVIFKDNSAFVDNLEIKLSKNYPSGKGNIIIDSAIINISTNKNELISCDNIFEGKVQSIFPFRNEHEVIINIGIELMLILSETMVEKLSINEDKTTWIGFDSNYIKYINLSSE